MYLTFNRPQGRWSRATATRRLHGSHPAGPRSLLAEEGAGELLIPYVLDAFERLGDNIGSEEVV
jgi:hypothetical protein